METDRLRWEWREWHGFKSELKVATLCLNRKYNALLKKKGLGLVRNLFLLAISKSALKVRCACQSHWWIPTESLNPKTFQLCHFQDVYIILQCLTKQYRQLHSCIVIILTERKRDMTWYLPHFTLTERNNCKSCAQLWNKTVKIPSQFRQNKNLPCCSSCSGSSKSRTESGLQAPFGLFCLIATDMTHHSSDHVTATRSNFLVWTFTHKLLF